MNSKKLISTILVGSFAALSLTACSKNATVKAEDAVIAVDASYIVAVKNADDYKTGKFGTPDPAVVAQLDKYSAILLEDLVIESNDMENNVTPSTDLTNEIKANSALILELINKVKGTN